MGEFDIEDFTSCASHDCDCSGCLDLDYEKIGDSLFLSFNCPECNSSSLEDDFRWYVRCPNCEPSPQTPVDTVEGGVKENGQVWFSCTECNADAESHIRTKWDGE